MKLTQLVIILAVTASGAFSYTHVSIKCYLARPLCSVSYVDVALPLCAPLLLGAFIEECYAGHIVEPGFVERGLMPLDLYRIEYFFDTTLGGTGWDVYTPRGVQKKCQKSIFFLLYHSILQARHVLCVGVALRKCTLSFLCDEVIQPYLLHFLLSCT